MNVAMTPQVLSDLNIVLTLFIFSVVAAAICGALGAVGGLIGKRVFK
jgi:hypothetical protein